MTWCRKGIDYWQDYHHAPVVVRVQRIGSNHESIKVRLLDHAGAEIWIAKAHLLAWDRQSVTIPQWLAGELLEDPHNLYRPQRWNSTGRKK